MVTRAKLPYPWFGGKSQVASLVWERFGDVRNYVEPFFGGGAVLLNRPAWHTGRVETINDINAFLTNFWRAVKADPDAVAHHADWPVNEIDLAARRDWLFKQTGHIEAMMQDPDWYDAKLAGVWVWGVWVWGVCSTIGQEWNISSIEIGPCKGIHSIHAKRSLRDYFHSLQDRLKCVTVICGDWKRLTSYTATTYQGTTGMFLDPPYIDGCDAVYKNHTHDVRAEVRDYCLAHGDEIRIALCGYEGEHDMPAEWDCEAWKANGGYENTGNGRGKANCKRERIWFSPACITETLLQETLCKS